MAIDLFQGGGGGGYDEAAVPLFSSQISSAVVTQRFAESSAAVTGTTYQTILSVSGSGFLRGVILRHTVNPASGNVLALRITIDGTEYEKTYTLGNTTQSQIATAPTTMDETRLVCANGHYFRFNESLVIEAYRTGSNATTCEWTHSLDRG